MAHQEIRKNTSRHFGAQLFMATVVSTDPGSLIIIVAPDGQQGLAHMQGFPLANTFAQALGFKETVLPQVGTRVLCYGGYSGFCLIIGSVPAPDIQDPNNPSFPSRAIIGAGEPLLEDTHAVGYQEDMTKAVLLNNQLPTDVVQGEKVIANEFGVMLGLFQMLSVLKGSDLAQVQCHFLDDLVRIISHNFQHYHALGEHSIFHDGKGLNIEIGLTHEPRESMGSPQIKKDLNDETTLTPVDENAIDDSKDFYQLDDERLKAIERVKVFIGKLGDFLNMFLVVPSTEYRALNGAAITKPDRGLFQAHLSLDGMLIVRSVKGIILEKTNWIRVPHRIRTPEDPEGDNGTDINYTFREVFGFDETYSNDGAPFLYYLQLRDYLAYLEEELNYSNFAAHQNDFSVNDDYSKETPLETITYVDPITGTSFQKKRSILALMPNGGLSMSDAWGSTIAMEGGNIYIQPANDLIVQPMRNVVAKVGGFVSMAAKKDIDLSSTTGGFRLKTDKTQYLYSNKSGIVLHSEGNFVEGGFMPNTTEEDTKQPAEYVSGIIFKAPNAGVQTYARQIYSLSTETAIQEAQEVIQHAAKSMHLLCDREWYASGRNLFACSEHQMELFTKGSVTLMGDISTFVGKKGSPFGLAKAGKIEVPVEGLLDVKDKQKIFYDALVRVADELKEFDPLEFVAGFEDEQHFKDLKFYFLPSERYGLTDSDVIPQTMVQLENATFPGLHTLEKWKEEPVNETYPYPGADKADCFISTTLSNLEQATDKELINKVKDLANSIELDEPINLFENYTVKL